MATIAIDLGGTIIKMALIMGDQIVKHENFPAHSKQGLGPKLKILKERISAYILDSTKAVRGVSMSFPGIVDSQEMRVLSTNKKYQDAEDFDFKEWVGNQFGLPFFLENDARSALVGEWQFGAGKGFQDIVMVTLGTGIGSATLIEGKLLRGSHFQGGCLGGHFIIDWDGHPCNCGNVGCAEAEASSWRLPDLLRSNPRFSKSSISRKPVLDFKTLFEASQTGDDLSLEIRNKCLDIWSCNIINLVHAYDPEIVIMGGGIMNSHDVIIPHVQKIMDSRAWTPWGKVKILKSALPESSALLGSNYLLNKSLDAE